MFVGEVRKLVGKRDLTDKEKETVRKASLIAALSSNHSWKTYKYLNNYCEMDKDALVEEFGYAEKEGWKRITENDVEEVINSERNPYALSMWFYNAIGDKERGNYNNTYSRIKKELAYGLEPMERQV